MKKLLMIFLIFGMVAVVSAATLAVSLTLKDTTFTPTDRQLPGRSIGILSFDCDGRSTQVTIDEPNMNWEENDFMPEIFKACNSEVTNLQDWTGRRYKDNCDELPANVCMKSWDENSLKDQVCVYNNLTYDKTSDECIEEVIVD